MIQEGALRCTAGSIPVVNVNNNHHRGRGRIATASFVLIAIAAAHVPGAYPAYASPSASDPFLLLLKGVYSPVTSAPNVGLAGINLNDGSFSVTDIYPINTAPSFTGGSKAVVGRFYTQFAGSLAVYDLPAGAIAMVFTAADNPIQIDDHQGGFYVEQTFELTIVQATGIYSSLVGGHNHMVDRAHILSNGAFDENCICIISHAAELPLWWSSN